MLTPGASFGRVIQHAFLPSISLQLRSRHTDDSLALKDGPRFPLERVLPSPETAHFGASILKVLQCLRLDYSDIASYFRSSITEGASLRSIARGLNDAGNRAQHGGVLPAPTFA